MVNRVQTLRSSTTGNRPTGRQPGELYVNFADGQIGVVNASSAAQDLVAVTFFSTSSNYAVGAFVIQGGQLYRAVVASSMGTFNPANWAQIGGSVGVGDTAPANPQPGTLWWDSVGGQLYVWYNDGNSSQWVIAVNAAGLVPQTSTTLPLMNGTAAIGASGKWADGAHVHPTDTTRAAASALSNYLPLSGGTVTGALTCSSALFVGGNVQTNNGLIAKGGYIQNWEASGAASYQIMDVTGATQYAAFYQNSGVSYLTNFQTGDSLNLGGTAGWAAISGSLQTGNQVRAGSGYTCKAGTAGGFDVNNFNIEWPGGAAHLWIDNVNQGSINVTSDYRIKKDVADLPSTWERVKALKPISYTQAEYHPAIATARAEGDPAMFPADDIERWGFIAHELQDTLVTSAATGVKDQPDLIQSPNWPTIVAALTKALQEAMARIETLEATR